MHSSFQTAVLHSASFANHDRADHPENQHRLDTVLSYLQDIGQLEGRKNVEFDVCAVDDLERVHDARYVAGLRALSESGGAWLDADTYVGPQSFDVARLAAGAAVAATDAVLSGRVHRALVLARPPGHHATSARGMGFCLFNSVAIAAAHALAGGLDRVAIVDWDVHHGNGTQDIYFESKDVLYCSAHQFPFYPGTGASDERGRGPGEGFTVNAPLPSGAGDVALVEAFGEVFIPALRRFEPELVLISAGFDAHDQDPLGGLRVTDAGFTAVAKDVLEISERYAGNRAVAVLEGGYNPDVLARSVATTLAVLDGQAV